MTFVTTPGPLCLTEVEMRGSYLHSPSASLYHFTAATLAFALSIALPFTAEYCLKTLVTLASELGTTLSTRCRERTVRRARFPTSDSEVFRRFLINFVTSTMDPSSLPAPTKNAAAQDSQASGPLRRAATFSYVPMSALEPPADSEPPPKRIIKFRELAPLQDGGLFSHEKFWRDHQQWLKDQGYMLRRRYHPDWIPSWQGTKRDPYECEDGLRYKRLQIMDGVRLSDGTVVMLKMVKRSLHPYEVEIAQMFSIEPLASNPHNHCVPVYEVLESPTNSDTVFLVMPFLRAYNDPRFDTVGEAMACIKQLLEGVHFLHNQRVAHRDIMNLNFMMDPTPMISETWHPHIPHRSYDTRRKVTVSTRTRHPVKYYIIDFGISRRYPADCVSPLEDPIWGGIKTVPEFQGSDEPRDPFPTDIYYVGYLLWEDFVEVRLSCFTLDCCLSSHSYCSEKQKLRISTASCQ
ncbi:hypothetical protein NUW54_g5662 [Trametes sanguinea]|uniref:Uncharacterized protein n=1 Tax=Trametes sanguinea TaxID=158606 RepID=A0ACC1PV01_9APHY|nr:hypothetical protein NUW54_g5662 [Trametes sanguinea]